MAGVVTGLVNGYAAAKQTRGCVLSVCVGYQPNCPSASLLAAALRPGVTCALFGPSLAAFYRIILVNARASAREHMLHLYLGKSYDDFASYRSSGNMNCVQRPMQDSDEIATCGSSTTSVPKAGFPLGTGVFGSRSTAGASGVGPSGSNSSSVGSGPGGGGGGYTANPVTELCNKMEAACQQDFAQAVHAARGLNAPAPYDVITGFESGCHQDRESHVLLLVGRATVHAIAHPTMDDMFTWAETLERHMKGDASSAPDPASGLLGRCGAKDSSLRSSKNPQSSISARRRGTANCDNYQGKSLLNIAGKIFARIPLIHLKGHLEQGLLPKNQCGFRRHRGTTDMIFTARQLQDKCQEMRIHLKTTFMDLTR
ncbi:unnamed protein product [Schistocephalus solidus]|uniref:Reverse transcriptase domain-containing protein n=1 Tax=Schistocephalus solidus TaxID=70667 RepID=A0A183SEF3_SCHSO|nr:unnamed protein product [Schistocephalus solidus]